MKKVILFKKNKDLFCFMCVVVLPACVSMCMPRLLSPEEVIVSPGTAVLRTELSGRASSQCIFTTELSLQDHQLNSF